MQPVDGITESQQSQKREQIFVSCHTDISVQDVSGLMS